MATVVEEYKYWEIETCPLAEECSEASWKRGKPWGDCEEEARARCMAHLKTSGLHHKHCTAGDRNDLYQLLVDGASCVEKTAAHKATKRPRDESWGDDSWDAGGGGGHAAGAGRSSGWSAGWDDMAAPMVAVGQARSAQNAEDMIAWEVQRRMEVLKREKDMALDVIRPSSTKRRGVNLTFEEAKDLAESLNRASKASSHIARLCSQAAKAFAEEKIVIDEVLETVQMRLLIRTE